MRTVIMAILLLFSCGSLWAQTGGSISGTVKDPSGAVIPDTAVTARNADGGAQQTLNSNGEGFYAFPTLPVGHYDIEAFRPDSSHTSGLAWSSTWARRSKWTSRWK